MAVKKIKGKRPLIFTLPVPENADTISENQGRLNAIHKKSCSFSPE
jgi:hypothetical protein